MPDPTDIPPAGALPERYELVDRIAEGGMAEVFRAVAYGDHGFEKVLAIKRILPRLARDPEFQSRFIGEAKLAVKLTHANIVQVLDFGRFGGSLFLAMEYVDGLDLAELCRRLGARGERVPVAAAFHIAIEIMRGLDYAHQRRVIHRDVSPSNILVSRAGEVKIADFGIALATADRAGAGPGIRRVMGKWRYMSPEQARGEVLDTRSDLFSAAAVLFELFTGDKLFVGTDADAILAAIERMPIPPASSRRPGLPPRLDELLARALERDPERRPPRPAEILRQLTEISYENSIVATPLEVAETVASVLGRARAGTEEGAVRPAGIDELIRRQLAVAVGGDGRLTDVAAAGEEAGEQAGEQSGEQSGEEAGGGEADAAANGTSEPQQQDGVDGAAPATPAERLLTTTTIVRRGADEDGVMVWDVDGPGGDAAGRAPAAAGEQDDRSGRRRGQGSRRRRTALAFAAVVVAAVGVGSVVGWAVWGRGDNSAASGRRARAAALRDAAERPARLEVSSTPAGGHVRIDGRPVPGITPLAVRLPGVGPHRVAIALPGYRTHVEKVEADPGETVVLRADLEQATASLTVATTPAGAEVLLDGERLGKTPLARGGLRPEQDASIQLRHAGYRPLSLKVDLAAGKSAHIERKLARAVVYGRINLQIDGGWADVYFRGKKIGQAPARGLALPVGKQRLRLYNPASGAERYVEVEVVPDEVRYYRTRL